MAVAEVKDSNGDIAILDATIEETKDVAIFSGQSFVHALSGATGSILAMSTFYPLDTIRTRLQIDDQRKAKQPWEVILELCNEEGVTTLYRGLVPVLTSLYCSNFVYFYTFHGLKKLALVKQIKPNPSLDLLIGYVSGVLNSLMTTPLWVANTRLKLQGIKMKQPEECKKTNANKNYKGLFDAIRRIADEEGLTALWSGIRTSFFLSGNPAIQFMVYEAIKRFVTKVKHLENGKMKAISNLEYFLMGGTAKAVATVLTYPLQLAQCRLRAGRVNGSDNSSKKQGLMYMLMQIYQSRGILGLFKGLEAKLMQTVLTAALMFLVYEKLFKFISKLVRIK
eukprot:gene9090-10060_t